MFWSDENYFRLVFCVQLHFVAVHPNLDIGNAPQQSAVERKRHPNLDIGNASLGNDLTKLTVMARLRNLNVHKPLTVYQGQDGIPLMK